jgi:hypothetical protein
MGAADVCVERIGDNLFTGKLNKKIFNIRGK